MKKIFVSGEIGWSVTAEAIRKDLKAAGRDDIEAHFSSPGGSVFVGLEIYNIFKDHKRTTGARMTSRIIGLAASMGSYLALNEAFDMVVAEDNAVFMIHNAAGGISGDKGEMRKMAEVLDGIDTLLAQVYARKTGKSLSEIKQLMNAESWFFGEELRQVGFVDVIERTGAVTDRTTAINFAKTKYSAVAAKFGADLKIAASLISDGKFSLPFMDGLTPEERQYRVELNASRIACGRPSISEGDPVTDVMAQIKRDRIALGMEAEPMAGQHDSVLEMINKDRATWGLASLDFKGSYIPRELIKPGTLRGHRY